MNSIIRKGHGERFWICLCSLAAVILICACQVSRALPFIPTPTYDDPVVRQWALAFDDNIQLQPGDSYQFKVGNIKCCYYFDPAVDVKAVWSVIPNDGATIDQSGFLTVDPAATAGSVYTVSANINQGEGQAEINVYIYTPEMNPLTGAWAEEIQFACDADEERQPEEIIRELIFSADGTFSVTWYPFEIYHDYVGEYQYDLQNGNLSLTDIHGNYVPENLDPSGTFSVDEEGRLILQDIWLGSSQDSEQPAGCGHRFGKY